METAESSAASVPLVSIYKDPDYPDYYQNSYHDDPDDDPIIGIHKDRADHDLSSYNYCDQDDDDA